LIQTIVADRSPRGADSRAKRRLRGDAAVPYGIHELVLAYNSISVPDEVNEQIENLRLNPDQFAPSP